MNPKPKIRMTSFEVLRKITSEIYADSIMTPRAEFTCCEPEDLLEEKLETMKGKFDALPMFQGTDLNEAEIHEYLTQENADRKIKQGYRYCKEACSKIEEEDKIPEDLPVELLFAKLALRKNKAKVPLFLLDENNQVAGLITVADLDKVAVKMYLFALISELELTLLKIISSDYHKLREVCKCGYCIKARERRKGKVYPDKNLEEYHYLYLTEIIHIILKSESLCESHRKVKSIFHSNSYGEIDTLRNAVAHPKPIVTDDFPLEKLVRLHNLIRDAIALCKSSD
jgi:hypothetical protein